MKLVTLLVIFLVSCVQAKAVVCSSKVQGLKREISLAVTPTYFIRVDTKSEKILMSGDCVLSLKDGTCLSQGRTWEPYPIAGKNLVTIPHCDNNASMCFYKLDNYKSQQESKPVFVDSGMKGYYQSVGFLKNTAKEAQIRVVSYYGVFRDYKINDEEVSPLGPAKKFCEGIDLKLPMLSKDGKMISGWNVEEEKTVLYKLSDEGKCTPEYKLEFMVGKMDFSYDGKYAAFHATSSGEGKISDDLGLNQQIFLLDLKSKKLLKLSSGADVLYYPHFGENGFMYALKLDRKSQKHSLLEIDVNESIDHVQTEANFCENCSRDQQQKLFKLNCL